MEVCAGFGSVSSDPLLRKKPASFVTRTASVILIFLSLGLTKTVVSNKFVKKKALPFN